jgi:hypothetical protein
VNRALLCHRPASKLEDRRTLRLLSSASDIRGEDFRITFDADYSEGNIES